MFTGDWHCLFCAFRFHPLYAAFFSVGVRKCLGVAILIRRVANLFYVKSATESYGRGAAVWFSIYDTYFLVIGLYLHVSRQYKDYEPLLSCTQALVVVSSDTQCVVLGDLNQNPGWVAGIPRAPSDIFELFNQFILDASLTRAEFANISPMWVGSQGWSNVLDYFLLRVPIPLPSAHIHSSSPFPCDHSLVFLSLPMRHEKQEPELWQTKH